MMSVEETRPEEVPAEEPEVQAETEPVAEEQQASGAVPPAGGWQARDVTDNDRLMAGLAYASQVVIPVVIPAVILLSEENKQRPFQKYHAVQSLGFLVAVIIYEVLAAIVSCALTAVTGGCLACLLWVLFLVPVVPALYYAYQAYQGLYFKIPFLTDFLVQSKWMEMPPA
ncbi:MAG: DUF4870 domain-containing protein [Chloroflexi bacterium]|nr:DUF4870 domain-containing protein [Chloroflexota bacterium]